MLKEKYIAGAALAVVALAVTFVTLSRPEADNTAAITEARIACEAAIQSRASVVSVESIDRMTGDAQTVYAKVKTSNPAGTTSDAIYECVVKDGRTRVSIATR